MHEARLEDFGSGLAPASDGWFVVNVRDAQWLTSENGEKQPSGSECPFESRDFWFRQFGIRLHVLPPGQPNGLYHSESAQEDFLVLSGECVLLVEGEERRLRQWDFFHSPAGTEHIFVGAGDEPCVILMAGARSENEEIRYPVSELAARHNASVHEETSDPDQAYVGRFEPSRRERPTYWDRLPWA
ncbi:MAG: cupin domain-containing protein [Verrucomicrobiota bacterium]